jgi:hypothetical protein
MVDARINLVPYHGRHYSTCVVVFTFSSFLSLLCHSAAAEEYLIKFDEVGYENVPGDVEKPPDKLFSSISVPARLDETFAARVTRLKRTYTVHGKLTRDPDGFFVIELRYKVAEHDGTTLESKTTVNMLLDEKCKVGGLISSTVAPRPTRDTRNVSLRFQ